ncbi:MAG: hypothetical protein MUC62_03980 [Candidatus Thermoplasmatota archaeon]|nr:hypothetical protein [Candidatus Thermoplasmatota archaeon]
MDVQGKEGIRRTMVLVTAASFLVLSLIGLLLAVDEPAAGASIGAITVTGGTKKTYDGVNYLLDGSITVSGSGSSLTFVNSTIALSQDVGSNGKLGGGDDHIYTISVSSGGTLEFRNSILTTQTDQLNPYFKIDITVDGSVSRLVLKDSTVEGPGSIVLTNSAYLRMDRSGFVELSNQKNLDKDIDGDGSSEDDKDYNDDGMLLTMRSGSKGLITDSELRDTFSFSVPQRDGIQAGNITLTGTGTNLTVINSFLDIDLETALSTGSHNMLKIETGAVAHLIGVAINNTPQARSGAINVATTSGQAVYYRWIGARVLDGMGIQVEDRAVQLTRVEGSVNRVLTNAYLTQEILDYMGRTTSTWDRTDQDGFAIVPVVTDLFTYGSMPNSDVTPDFKVSLTIGTETLSASTSFPSYPTLPGQGDQKDLFQNIKEGKTLPSSLATTLKGSLKFSEYVVDPSGSSFFSDLDNDMTVASNIFIKGTSSIVNGKFYPSYYAFDGHLLVTSTGTLTINDTEVSFLTDEGNAFILVENGGKVFLNNVTLAKSGKSSLYLYMLGSSTPTFKLSKGKIDVENIVLRDASVLDIEGTKFNGSVNMHGQSVNARISAKDILLKRLFARSSTLSLGGGKVNIGSLDWKGVSFSSSDSVFDLPFDIDRTANLVNVSFKGNLPAGRSGWVEATGSGLVSLSYWTKAKVQDSVSNSLGGATVTVDRVEGSATTPVGTYSTDANGVSKFSLLQEELREAGRTFMGNYRLIGTYRGFSSTTYSTTLQGTDVDAIVVIPGGPNLRPNHIKVDGALITGNPVIVEANISNIGQFDANNFQVQLIVAGQVVGEMEVQGLAAGSSVDVPFPWVPQNGQMQFILRADPYSILMETDETDNTFTQTNYIGLGPDYSISLMPSTNEWVFGVQGGIDVEVTNVGEDDPSSTPFTVDITYDGSTSSGTVISALPIPYIAPGDSYTTTVTWVPDTYGPVALMGVINALFDRVPLNSMDTEQIVVRTLPDLKVQDGSFTISVPSPVTVNTTATISFIIVNTGEIAATDFNVAVYDGLVDPDNIMGTPVKVLLIGPGGNTKLDVPFFAGLPLGTHDLTVVIDIDDDVPEQNETNNMAEFPVSVDTPPDLTFTQAYGATPRTVTDGKNVTFWATVKNVGRTIARNAEVQFSIDSEVNMIATKVITLLPDQSMNVSTTWMAEGLGLHDLLIDVDPKDRILEPRETNNQVTTEFRVISKPDIFMEVTDLRQLTDGSLEIGRPARFNVTIRNGGETEARNVFIRFYDGDPESGGKIVQWSDSQPSASFNLIGPGKVRYTELTWVPTKGGMHDLFIILDLSNYVLESNEDNNKVSWPLYVLTLPDISLTDVSIRQGPFSVSSAGVGSQVTINITIENLGDSTSPAFKLSVLNGEYSNDPLAVRIGAVINYLQGRIKGHSKTYTEVSWTVAYPKGLRAIFVNAESQDLSEQGYANNIRSIPFEIFDIKDVPELTYDVGSLRLTSKYSGMSPDTSGVGFFGTNITVSFNMTNIGGKGATNCTVHFLVSNTTSSWLVHSTQVGFMEDNSTEPVIGYWVLDTLGMTTLSVLIDPENGIREFDEGNNLLTRVIDIQPAPDLSVNLFKESDGYDLETGRFKLTKGSSYMVTYRLTNTGNFSYNRVQLDFSGDANENRKFVDIGPYGTIAVEFEVEPRTVHSDPVLWGCTVNKNGAVYESDTRNNQVNTEVIVKEQPKEINVLIPVLIVLVLFTIVVAALAFFIYKRYQEAGKAKCSNCGGLVDLEATVCTHCGIEFSDELECDCGTIIPSGASECPNCHKPILGALVGPKEGEVPSKDEPEELEEITEDGEGEGAAPEAGAKDGLAAPLSPETSGTTKTDVSTEKAENKAPEEELAECFECGALIPVSAPICPHCGAVFE